MNNERLQKYMEFANDQAKFDHVSATQVSAGMAIELHTDYLVKLMPAEIIKVPVKKPVPNGKKDKVTGAELYDVVETTEEMENPIVEAIVMALPTHPMANSISDYVLGEHVLVIRKAAMQFYNHMNTEIYTIGSYSIVGRVKADKVKASNEGTPIEDLPKIEYDEKVLETAPAELREFVEKANTGK